MGHLRRTDQVKRRALLHVAFSKGVQDITARERKRDKKDRIDRPNIQPVEHIQEGRGRESADFVADG